MKLRIKEKKVTKKNKNKIKKTNKKVNKKRENKTMKGKI